MPIQAGDEQYGVDGVRSVKYRCPCGCSHTIASLDGTPNPAKHKCRFCGGVNEVNHRESAYYEMDEHVGEGKHTNKMMKRTSINVGGEKPPEPKTTKHRAGFLVVDRRRSA